jgi:hypothetical protein
VEPISPELVLVDPELARVARPQLRDLSESVVAPRRRHALPAPPYEVETTAQQSAEVGPGAGDLMEVEPLSGPPDLDRVPTNPGKGERLRRAFEERLAER